MKNASDGLASRLNMAKERISELEDILIQFSKNKNQREQVFQGLWDNHNRCDIHSIGLPEGKERKSGRNIFKNYDREFPSN